MKTMTMRDSDLLAQFLRQTGWPEPPSHTVADGMQEALAFFHLFLPEWTHRALDETDPGYRTHGFSDMAFKINGKVTKLTSAMMGINFLQPVYRTALFKEHRVRRYGKENEPLGAPARGDWYTEESVPASLLALPPEQHVPFDYEVEQTVPALVSIAGDMLVDWGMKPKLPRERRLLHIDYHYRHGGGLQYVIPVRAFAGRVLRPL